jgi:hypothetical protein
MQCIAVTDPEGAAGAKPSVSLKVPSIEDIGTQTAVLFFRLRFSCAREEGQTRPWMRGCRREERSLSNFLWDDLLLDPVGFFRTPDLDPHHPIDSLSLLLDVFK